MTPPKPTKDELREMCKRDNWMEFCGTDNFTKDPSFLRSVFRKVVGFKRFKYFTMLACLN